MNFETITKNLKALGYQVTEKETKGEAVAYLAETLKGKTIGMGGSTTIKEMDLYNVLAKESVVYISSVNGIAETGEIINIDHSGNRVAGTVDGHDKVVLIIGENKIAPDYDKAYYRARNIAGPKNAQRLHRKTPCAIKADKCYDCKSPERICRAVCTFLTKPAAMEYEIVLVHENLGY